MLTVVNLRMELTRSKDAFALMAAGGDLYTVVIVAALLLIRKVKISPSVYLAHANTLEIKTAK